MYKVKKLNFKKIIICLNHVLLGDPHLAGFLHNIVPSFGPSIGFVGFSYYQRLQTQLAIGPTMIRYISHFNYWIVGPDTKFDLGLRWHQLLLMRTQNHSEIEPEFSYPFVSIPYMHCDLCSIKQNLYINQCQNKFVFQFV